MAGSLQMTHRDISPEQRRKNIRVAWLLAAFVAFVFIASIPFWKGLFQLAMGTQG